MRLEQNAASTLGCYWQAVEGSANPWCRLGSRRDLELPAPGIDGSWNFAPAYRAARGEWEDLGRVLDRHWEHAGDNEFLSPLYGHKIYVAAALGALLGGGERAWIRLHRLTALHSLMATVVETRTTTRIRWAGEPTRVRHLSARGVAIPTAGCRVNGAVTVEPHMNGVLAHALGIPHAYRNRDRWRRYDPPAAPAEWSPRGGRGNAPQPWCAVETLRAAEKRTGRRLRDVEWNRYCARAARGDLDALDGLYGALAPLLALPRRCTRLLVERRGGDVLTALEGCLWTRQKPSIAACSVTGTTVMPLLVAPWRVPSDRTTSRIDDAAIVATAGRATDSIPRLEAPDRAYEFAPRSSA